MTTQKCRNAAATQNTIELSCTGNIEAMLQEDKNTARCTFFKSGMVKKSHKVTLEKGDLVFNQSTLHMCNCKSGSKHARGKPAAILGTFLNLSSLLIEHDGGLHYNLKKGSGHQCIHILNSCFLSCSNIPL